MKRNPEYDIEVTLRKSGEAFLMFLIPIILGTLAVEDADWSYGMTLGLPLIGAAFRALRDWQKHFFLKDPS